MTARAEMETRITGTDAGIKSLGQLEDALGRVGKQGQSVANQLKGFHDLWKDPVAAKGGWSQTERVLTSIGKASADIIGRQVGDIASAVTAPAKTSYQGAINLANYYRDTTQRVATSTGSSYAEINKQVMGASSRLGLMPAQVQEYGRGVRQMTGDWRGAVAGLDAFQARALKTDRSLGEMIPTATQLAQTFGIKSTAEAGAFFATIDSQATKANVSAQVLERTFMGFSGMLTSLTSARAPALANVTAQIMGGAPTVEMGESRMGALGGYLQQHSRYFERRMRTAGKLGKGESAFDEEGRIRPDKFADMIEVAQRDAERHYGTKNRRELIGRMAESGLMSMQDAAGIMKLDPAKMRAAVSATDQTGAILSTDAASAASARRFAEASKARKDIGFGGTFLGAQDAAVGIGGGAAGVAMASAGQMFEKSAGVFWDAVNIFAGKAAPGLVPAAAGGAAAGGGGATATSIATGAAAAAILPVAAMAGVGYLGYQDIMSEKPHWDAVNAKRASDKQRAAQLQVDMPTLRRLEKGGMVAGGDALPMLPESAMINQAQADAIGTAVAKHLGSGGVTLRTQSIQPAEPPPSMSPAP